ncbi:NEK1, partial [Symbiodinium necroappetens]
QNIFLSNAGGGGCIVKIGDFGIAKVLQHTRGLAQTLIGTPSNLPPEVCDSKPYGTKADIWSLGVVFYELLTLEPPFKAMSLAALAIKIVNGEPKPIVNDFYAEEVRGLVRPMLEKDPARRPSAARLLQKNPLRRVAQMPSLPMLMERPSSGSISEVETLTPASVGRASLGVL